MLLFGIRHNGKIWRKGKLTRIIENCFWIVHVVDIDMVIAYTFVTNKLIMPPYNSFGYQCAQ